jgi:hypothetical protein
MNMIQKVKRASVDVAVVRLVRNTRDLAELHALDRGVMSGFHR